MKVSLSLIALAAICASTNLNQSALAQAGTTNGTGSGFLNTDIIVGRGGMPGPAELNPFLEGADWRYHLLPSYYQPGLWVGGNLVGMSPGTWQTFSAIAAPYGLRSRYARSRWLASPYAAPFGYSGVGCSPCATRCGLNTWDADPWVRGSLAGYGNLWF